MSGVSGERVVVQDQLAHPLVEDMGVDFRGAEVGVAQQGLDRAQVRAAFQQMRGEGVAQHMGRDLAGGQARGGGQMREHPVEGFVEELAQLLSISLLLAQERLLTAERAGKICRDDSIEGLRFYPNLFLNPIE